MEIDQPRLSDTFPEMIKYLALRIALDLNSELIRSSELAQTPSEWELSFALNVLTTPRKHGEFLWRFDLGLHLSLVW
jgi:hypothetical protein